MSLVNIVSFVSHKLAMGKKKKKERERKVVVNMVRMIFGMVGV